MRRAMGAARRSVLGLAQRRAEILVDVGQGGGALVQGEIAYGRKGPGVVRQGPAGGTRAGRGRDGAGRGRGGPGAHPQLLGAPTTCSSGTSGAASPA